MSDWEISAATQAQLVTVAKAIVANRNINFTAINGPDGFITDGFLNNGTQFSIFFYKTKKLATGNLLQGVIGKYPETTTVPGFFAILRWLHPTNANPPQPSQASGVTLIPLPANSPVRFA
jgi:hypothetical protein